MNGNPIVMVKGMGLFEAVPLQSLLSGAQVAPQQRLVPQIAFAIIKDMKLLQFCGSESELEIPLQFWLQ